MAATNGYTPEQASPTSTSPTARSTTGCGASTRSSATRSRCTRRGSNPGFYPPDELIAAQTSRNREAVLTLLEYADCLVPGRSARRPSTAAPAAAPTVYFDNFEAATGWTVNANGTDTATTGRGSAVTRPRPQQRDQAARHDGERDERPRDRRTGRRVGRRRSTSTAASPRSRSRADRAAGGGTLHALVLAVPGPRVELEQRGLPARGLVRRRTATLTVFSACRRGHEPQRRLGRRRRATLNAVRAARPSGSSSRPPTRRPPASSRPASTTCGSREGASRRCFLAR